MTVDRRDEENEGQDAFTVDEQEIIDGSEDVTASDIAAEGLELPPPD